jgi:hypothetical protein
MESNTPVTTQFGNVPLSALILAYEQKKQKIQVRNEWFKTDAGKEYNRMKAKQYYDKHKETVLAKRAVRYEAEGDALRTRANEYYHRNSETIKKKNKEKKLAAAEV